MMPQKVQLIAPSPTLKTKRLVLRALQPQDQATYFILYQNALVSAAHGATPWQDPQKAAERISWYNQAAIDNIACRWAITQGAEDRLIGSVGFHSLSVEHFRGEIGYDLMPTFWGQGIVSEAVRAVIQFGFEQIGFHRIEAIVDPNNAASAGVLRKVGFTEEGFLRQRFFDNGRFVDDWFFSILRPEFENQTNELPA
jgi:ribosomal-protein-alanine N-acetyltransferase